MELSKKIAEMVNLETLVLDFKDSLAITDRFLDNLTSGIKTLASLKYFSIDVSG